MLTAAVQPESLLPVAVETIRCGETFEFELYLREFLGAGPVLYRGKNVAVQRSDLESLQRRGIRTLFITIASLPQYERYLRERVLGDATSPPAARFCALREANRSLFLAALEEKNLAKVVNVADEIAAELVDIVCAEERTVTSLFKLLSHDYYTFTHVTNVCVYTLALATRLGITSHRDLIALGAGALLHDVGKRKVPAEILNKRGRLTKREFSLVKAHPIIGFRDLCDQRDLSWPQLMMVYQHHERLDGHGYPVGISGDEIHPWARMCAVADVYDALTSRRAYRGPIPAMNVREFLLRNAGPHLDAEMVSCWNAMLDS